MTYALFHFIFSSFKIIVMKMELVEQSKGKGKGEGANGRHEKINVVTIDKRYFKSRLIMGDLNNIKLGLLDGG